MPQLPYAFRVPLFPRPSPSDRGFTKFDNFLSLPYNSYLKTQVGEIIRENDPKYKAWLKRRNLRALIRRTERKKSISYSQPHEDTKQAVEWSRDVILFPRTLSIIENYDEAVEKFSRMLELIYKGRHHYHIVFCDLSVVQAITIDAIMYLIALIKNLRKENIHRLIVSGNEPVNYDARKFFRESGFYKYVSSKRATHVVPENQKSFQIESGYDVNTNVLRKICDYIKQTCQHPGISSITKDLYRMIGEMMTNTVQHAYTGTEELLDHWYIFIERSQKHIRFVFLDIGLGIPETIRKKFVEKIVAKSDSEFIYSALKGEFRTETMEPFRGKGLPSIFERFQKGMFSDIIIQSGNGRCHLSREKTPEPMLRTLNRNIVGTLFSWAIVLPI